MAEHGILEDIPHRKFLRGVLLMNEGDTEKVVEYLRQFSADFYTGTVELTPDDEKILRGPIDNIDFYEKRSF